MGCLVIPIDIGIGYFYNAESNGSSKFLSDDFGEKGAWVEASLPPISLVTKTGPRTFDVCSNRPYSDIPGPSALYDHPWGKFNSDP